jgi:hypothetical protein
LSVSAAAAVLALLGALTAGCDDLPPVIIEPLVETPSEPAWEPAVPINNWKYIIVHHSGTAAGSAEIFDKFHREQRHFANGLGYHFVIGNGTDSGDGQVEVGGRWTGQLPGAHTKGGEWNKEGIGVCLVGDFMQQHPTERQMASLLRLLNFLQARCQIPSRMVFGHREVVEPGYTKCPGDNLSMPQLRAGLPAQPPVYRAVKPNGPANGGRAPAALIDPDTGEPFPALPVPEMSAPKRRHR